MKTQTKQLNEQGIAHIGLMIVVIAVIVGVGYLVYWRFQSADNQNNTTQIDASSEDESFDQLSDGIDELGSTNVTVDENNQTLEGATNE